MIKRHNQGVMANLKNDIPASIVVFLVAVPLCLGIALASGAPLFSGIIAGIIGGIVVGLLSGSPLGVSGPAAGLAVIVLSAIQSLGAFETFLLAVMVAGVIQLVFGFLKAGIIGYYFPSSVIKGVLSGIGVLIILKQVPHAFGYDKDPEGDFGFMQVDGHNTFSELVYMLEAISPGPLVIALVSMTILIIWEQPFIKKMTFSKVLQGPLLAVMAGIGLNVLFAGFPGMTLLPDQMVNIPVAGSFSNFFTLFTFPDFSQLTNPQVYSVGLTIAVVASLETLLCVEAADKLDPQKRVTPANRELMAQGVGNMFSGFIGGLPITQVIVRSSANILSGGRTATSAVLHGVLLLACAMAIPHVLNLVPLSSLAAILLVVGYKLTKPVLFREMFAMGKAHFVPFMITILGIVFTDLLMGIALGMAVAIFHILWNNYKVPYHFEAKEHADHKPVTIRLSEDVSFLNKASILRSLSQLPDDTQVIIDASKTKSIHPDVIEIIEDFRLNAVTRGIAIELIDLVKADNEDSVEQFGHLVLKHPKRKKRKTIFKQKHNKKAYADD